MKVGATFEGYTLADYFAERHPHRDVGHWQEACDQRRLRVDAKLVTQLKLHVRAGNRIEHAIPDTVEPWVDTNVGFLYEDEQLMVLNKSAPLAMHPSGRFNRNTLVPLLKLAFPGLSPRPVHRLDADTTGVVVLAKTREAARWLSQQFAAREVSKTYLARVLGSPGWDSHSVVAEFSKRPSAHGLREVVDQGLSAQTELCVHTRFEGSTLLEVRPRSGRTNQIRLQLSHIGLPIVGDSAYGEGGSVDEGPDHRGSPGRAMSGQSRLCLHAWRIEFVAPGAKRASRFEAAIPRWGTATVIG